MRTLITLLAPLLVCAPAFATAQYADWLVLDGTRHKLHSNPLEPYFEKYPERRPTSAVTCSALWRGYVATLEIVDAQLQVKDVEVLDPKRIEGPLSEQFVSVIDRAFPAGTNRLLDEFTGFLILPQGTITEYIHMGYASKHERYRLLFIRKGRVAADRVFSAEEYGEYKTLQFEAFTRTERFKQMQQQIGRSGGGTLRADYFLYIFDASFPMETLIDYKDFRPNSGSVDATSKR